MDGKKRKMSGVLKYNLTAIGTVVLMCAVFLLLYPYLDGVAFALLLAAAAVIGYIFFVRCRYHFIYKPAYSALYKDFDPDKFNDVTAQWKNSIWRLNEAAYYSGDYQSALDFSSAALDQAKSKKQKLYYLIRMMRVYLDLDDKEQLADAVKKYRELIAGDEKLEKASTFADYCEKYAAGDYTGALSVDRNVQQASRSPEHPALVLSAKFTTALAYFKSGDRENARPLFEEIVSAAPKFGFAKISQKYLDAIESGSADPEFEKLTVDSSLEDEIGKINAKSAKIRKTRKIILLVLAFILIAELIFLGYMKRHPNYPDWVREAPNEVFVESEVLNCFSLVKDDYFYGTVGVCKTSAGLVVGSYGFIDGEEGETIQFSVLGDHMEEGKHLTASERFEDETVTYEFAFCENKRDVPKDALHVTTVRTKEYDGYLYFISVTSSKDEN